MKPDDVFNTKDREQLFIAITVTPSGAVYARKFDPARGAYGGFEAFPSETKFNIHFNFSGKFGKIGNQIIKSKIIAKEKLSISKDRLADLKQSLMGISIPELEKRMRPGAWSDGGFLGQTESLTAVIDQDAGTLVVHHVTYEQIATKIEQLIVPAMDIFSGDSYYFDLHQSKNTYLDRKNYPPEKAGYVDGNFQVFTIGFRGMQECPWGCNAYGSHDFLILNRRLGEFIEVPELIIHLIRAHHFFEGVESPYRTDPTKVVRVLELA